MVTASIPSWILKATKPGERDRDAHEHSSSQRKCYPTQRWQIFRHYEPDIHFFVSCVDDAQAGSAELLREHYQNVHIERYTDPVLSVIPDSAGVHAPYKNAASHQKLLLQHWANKRAWDFFWIQGLVPKCGVRYCDPYPTGPIHPSIRH
jgi:hypothetical protein